ncbi:MAG TPA: hypothetical protein VFE27_23665 [Acidobacteriaceae bacterium]|jgi:hypothetical protein|nr:hypothetical protein [Acidobacteriaceae bacterium]
MRVSDFYRGLLLLYPADFRRQFSEEIVSVFEQRARDQATSGEPAFFAVEFVSIVKGASTMWLTKILSVKSELVPPEAPDTAGSFLTLAELAERRSTAIKNMVASIAKHDFINARQYSDEEVRLKRLIQNVGSADSVAESGTAW